MKYAEEDLATDLHEELIRRFDLRTTDIALSGAGVHWKCVVARDRLSCDISCFTSFGPEYYTSFERDSTAVAFGRTPLRDDTIDAVDMWLAGIELPALYDRFAFVDRHKRALGSMHDEVLTLMPDCKPGIHSTLNHRFADLYDLRFKHGDRSCKLSFRGKHEFPDAKFSWAECELFEYQADDVSRFADVLRSWLCDRAMPSKMRADFSWLQIGELADYYENGNPVEGEFIHSWDRMEHFYQEFGRDLAPPVLSMIRAMREAGYDHTLRAGQSMWSLGLSRARRHGLAPDQPCIWFSFHGSHMDVGADFAGKSLKNHPIDFTDDVRALLDALVCIDIE